MGAKILIVDDDPSVLQLMGLTLHRAGYEVVVAQNGVEALKKVLAVQPDLIILDLMMPEVSGIEVCQRLRSQPQTANVPIIVLSAMSQTAEKVKALKAGADEYLVKPVEHIEMAARIEALLERTRRLRQAQPVKVGKVLSFVGAKGGVGTTTVALNVASVLANQHKTVTAVELRSYYGTLNLQLKQTPTENLRHLLELDPARLGERDIGRRLYNLPSGLRVLFSPQRIEESREIEAPQAEALITGLASMADYTIVDLPCYPSNANAAAIQHSDFIGLVLEPEPVCVQASKMTLELLKLWGIGGQRVGAIVVNRAVLATPIREIRSQLGCEIVGVIPPATEAHLAAQAQGVPLVLHQATHIAANNLIELANRLSADKIVGITL